METAQTVLIVVVCLLTILLTVIGVQVFLILKDLRQSVKKTNLILDDAQLITRSVSHPLVNLAESLAKITSLVTIFTGFLDRHHKGEHHV